MNHSHGTHPDHLPALDGLRGLAIVCVLAHNLAPLEHAQGLAKALQMAFDLGWVGVQLFFALSGYLITHSLLLSKQRPDRVRHFFMRRALRILPLYYGGLLLCLVLLPAAGRVLPGFEADVRHQAWHWLFVSNWAPAFVGGFTGLPHDWSLAVEEQFYLLWPWVVWRCSVRQLLCVCAGLMVAAPACRACMLALGAPAEWVYQASTSRMDALAAGAAVAAWLQMPSGPWHARINKRAVAGLALALLVMGVAGSGSLFARTTPRGQVVGYTALALLSGLAVLATVNWQPCRLQNQLLCALGKYSFCIYLIHKPLHDLFGLPWLQGQGWAATASAGIALAYLAAAGALCLAMAWFTYHAYEKRFLALKRQV